MFATGWRKKGKDESFCYRGIGDILKTRKMAKLSQFVRSRLALQQRQFGEHPDSDLLSAFAERNLSSREHADVMAHLAQCSACREILALGSRSENSESPSLPNLRRRDVIWWVWRGAGAAAVICLMIAVLWHAPLLQNSTQHVSILQSTAPPKAQARVPWPSAPSQLQPESENGHATRSVIPRAPNSAVRQQSRADLGSAKQASSNESAFEAESQAGQRAKSARGPRAVQPPSAPSIASASESSAEVTGTAAQGLAVKKPQSPSAVTSNSMFSIARRESALRRVQLEPRSTLWSLDVSSANPSGAADGAVQKSTDGGTTWQTIRVNDHTRLYALSAAGSDVWVGGAGGALFHSTDSGLHWSTVAVADDAAPLTSTITRIDVHDDNSIRLKTILGEEWASADGGLHWRRE